MNQTPENFEETRDLDPSPDSVRLGSTELHQELQDAAIVGILIGGKYKLIQRIGEGGMGTVWLAEQREPVRRKVAVKLVKAGMDSRQVLGRFDAERQALAVMDHPNIAKVFDGGVTEQGRPYFAMELVKGIPLTDYCDQVQYSVIERLELFIQVCSAVQHAHQKGIIHRDLKPSNILVTEHDGKPMVKVIDFGLAKALHGSIVLTDHSMQTAFGAVLGTPLYMAPEQLGTSALDVDTRADLYSLGVVLYELLTGTTPIERKRLKQAAWDEMCRMIREEEPPRPSTRLSSSDALPSVAARRHVEPAKLTRLVRGELDWIIMKTLEKDRNRRYETANGLGLDIQRYLAGEAVTAAPQSRLYRLRKFAHRNRGVVTAAALLLISLIIGTIGTSFGLLEARRQTSIAEGQLKEKEVAQSLEREHRQRAETERQFAEAQRLKAEQNLEFALAGTEILSSVFAGLDPRAEYTTVGELRDALSSNLTTAIEQLESSKVGAPLDVAHLQERLALSLQALGDFSEAVAIFERVLETRRTLLGRGHKRTLDAMNNLSTAYLNSGNRDLAISLMEEVLELRKENMEPDHPDTLTSMNNLAYALHDNGQLDKALPLFEESLQLTQAKLGIEHPDTLISINNLAAVYFEAGTLDRAVSLWEQVSELRNRVLGLEHPDSLIAKNNLAVGYQAIGQLEKAIELLEQNLGLITARLGAEHPETITCMNNLASGYYEARRLEKALSLWEKTFEIEKAKYGFEHAQTLTNANNLAAAYLAANEPRRALALWEQTLEIRTKKLGIDHPHTILSLKNLATGYDAVGESSKAISLWEQALNLGRQKLGTDHPTTFSILGDLGEAYQSGNQLDKALPLFEEAVDIVMARGLGIKQAGPILRVAIKGHEAAGLFHKADSWRESWIAFVKLSQGEYSKQYVNALADYGQSLTKRQDWTRAISTWQLCLSHQQGAGIEAWTIHNSQSLLGAALTGQGKLDQAEPLLLSGYEGLKSQSGAIPPQAKNCVVEALNRIIDFYQRTENTDELTQWQQELNELLSGQEGVQ